MLRLLQSQDVNQIFERLERGESQGRDYQDYILYICVFFHSYENPQPAYSLSSDTLIGWKRDVFLLVCHSRNKMPSFILQWRIP